MAEEASLRVELDGFHYNLISNTSVERLQEISELVANKIAKIREETPHYSTTRAAMLVALQLAEEMLNLQDEYLALLEEADIGAELPLKREPSPPPAAQPQASQQTLPLEENQSAAPPPQKPHPQQQKPHNHKQKNRHK